MISVIIPIFNGESYIDDLVKTLISQSEKDFEVVFINDGSTDSTAQKLDALSIESPFRMLVVHQKNQGVSASRNTGLEMAKGQFICFVDSDDSLATDYLGLLKKTMEETTCRVVLGHITRELSDLDVQQSVSTQIFNNVEFCREFLYRGNKFSICAALFDIKVFHDYNLRFWENYQYSEDVHLLWRLFAREARIAVLSSPIYYYRNNPLSAMGKVDERRIDAIRLMESLESYISTYVPTFSYEFIKYAVARHHWSILWQAAYYYNNFKDFVIFSKKFEMHDSIIKLFDYPERLIAFSSRMYAVSPRLYYLIIRGYLKIKRRK